MCALNVNQYKSATTRPRRSRAGGFTLLELLVVVVIIGVLAAIAIPMYGDYVDKAQVAVATSTLDAMRKEFEAFHIDNAEYPAEPVDFTDGKDGASPRRIVFSNMFLEQINGDLTDVIYNTSITNGYEVTAKARNKTRTAMTLTPTEITKAP